MRENFSRLSMATATCALYLLCEPVSAQSTEFALLAGAWTGSGSIALSDGSTERLRCRAIYRVEGAGLQQSLRCASDSYKFELSSDLISQGSRISGTWSESSRGLNAWCAIQLWRYAAVRSAFAASMLTPGLRRAKISSHEMLYVLR